MLSPFRLQPNNTKKCSKKSSNTNVDNNSHCEQEHKRSQGNSNGLKRPQKSSNDPEIKPVKNKNKLKGVASIDIDDKYLDETLDNINL